MALRSRWMALLAILGCDHASAPEPLLPIVLAACETPTLEDAAQCEAPPLLDAASEASIDPTLPGDPNLRRVEALVHVGPDMLAAVGHYGDMVSEGAWVVAIAPDATRVWSATVPTTDEFVAVHASGDAEGIWIAGAQLDEATLARRYDLTGAQVGEILVPDFVVTSLLPQPLGAVAMTGTSGGDPAYVGVAADGTELWNGSTNDAEGPYLVAAGSVQYFDGPGAAVWEHDPRGTPADNFPIEIGVERAIIASTGDILAIGEVLGPLGDNTLIVRITAGGRPAFSQGRPRSHAEVVLEGVDDTTIVAGRSFHCTPGSYLGVFSITGELLQESRVEAPPSPWAVDLDGNAVSVGIDRGTLVLRTFEVES